MQLNKTAKPTAKSLPDAYVVTRYVVGLACLARRAEAGAPGVSEMPLAGALFLIFILVESFILIVPVAFIKVSLNSALVRSAPPGS